MFDWAGKSFKAFKSHTTRQIRSLSKGLGFMVSHQLQASSLKYISFTNDVY